MNTIQRPLEFRVWDKKRKLFRQDGYLSWHRLNNEQFYQFNTSDGWCLPPSQLVLQQFIGLLDKNGKKIFEGDIVKTGTLEGVVEAPNETNMGAWSFGGGYTLFAYKVTIIGNSFENPELLK